MTQIDTSSTRSALDEATVRRLDRDHVFHSWSAQALIDPLPIASASGSYFTDYQGNRFLDFSSQLVNINIGYQHPKVVAAIVEQAQRLCTVQPAFANDVRGEAAGLIAEVAPGTTGCSSPTAEPRPTRTPSAWPSYPSASPPASPSGHTPEGSPTRGIRLPARPRSHRSPPCAKKASSTTPGTSAGT